MVNLSWSDAINQFCYSIITFRATRNWTSLHYAAVELSGITGWWALSDSNPLVLFDSLCSIKWSSLITELEFYRPGENFSCSDQVSIAHC